MPGCRGEVRSGGGALAGSTAVQDMLQAESTVLGLLWLLVLLPLLLVLLRSAATGSSRGKATRRHRRERCSKRSRCRRPVDSYGVFGRHIRRVEDGRVVCTVLQARQHESAGSCPIRARQVAGVLR